MGRVLFRRSPFEYKYPSVLDPTFLGDPESTSTCLPQPSYSLPRRPHFLSPSSAGSTMKFSASLVIITLAVAASASPLNVPRGREGGHKGHHGKGGNHNSLAVSSSVRATSAASSSSVVRSATAATSSKAVGAAKSSASSSVAKSVAPVASSTGATAVVCFLSLSRSPTHTEDTRTGYKYGSCRQQRCFG